MLRADQLSSIPKKLLTIDTFFYTAPITTIAANSRTSLNILIDSDSDFLWSELNYSTTINFFPIEYGDILNTTPISVIFKDAKSGAQFNNISTAVDLYSGNKGLPLILPELKLLPARTLLELDITNYGSVNISNFCMTLIGTKVFRTL